MENLGFVAIPAIVAIVYVIAELLKNIDTLDKKWLPVICMAAGGALGVVESVINPGSISGDVLSAIAVGIASGLAATGVHQVGKQLGGSDANGAETAR